MDGSTMSVPFLKLPLAFSQVTSETCRKLIAKIVTEEDRYWDEDGKIDENQGVDIS
jgi:hypothetical protein